MSNKIEIRLIKPEDNAKLALIIRQVLTEFKANFDGTPFTDSKTDAIFETFKTKNGRYFVAILNDELVGGGGILPLEGDFKDTCELQKMYLLPKARGLKIGYQIIGRCFEFAKKEGFKKCYLETFPTMKKAQVFYQKLDFVFLDKPLVKACHTACHIWMLKQF